MTADNTEADGQPHASAGLSFGGEERIEEALLDFGCHTGAGVGDVNHHAFAILLGGHANLAA